MTIRRAGYFFLFLFVLLTSSLASADTLALSQILVNIEGTQGYPCNITDANFTTCSFTGSDGVVSVSGTATAKANYGNLGVYAYASLTELQLGQGHVIQPVANATATDGLTFSGFTGTAYLTGTVFLHGSESGTGMANFATDFIDSSGVFAECAIFGSDTVRTCTLSLPVQVTDFVTLRMYLGGSASGVEMSAHTGTADFLNTAAISSLLLVDSSGHPINGATIIAASGTQYPTGTPEPGALILLATGAIAVVRRANSRRMSYLLRPHSSLFRRCSSRSPALH